MNEIVKQLPQCYRDHANQENIADALTRGVADYLETINTKLINYESAYLDPKTCDEQWLDTLAQWAGWGNLWNSSWGVETKRKLLINTDFIWSNRGNRECLNKLFEIFNLNAKLSPATGFILRVSTFPSRIGSDPFDWQIKVPTNYSSGTPERSLVERLARNFLPCWVNLEIVN